MNDGKMSDAGDSVPAAPEAAARAVDAPTRGAAWKIVATVVVLAGAVAGLIYFSLDASAAYYMHVDEALARQTELAGKRLQVHGFVVKDSIEQKPGTLEYRFRMETRPPRAPGVIAAYYTGIVPDTFKSESEVVATGRLDKNNDLHIEAGGVMAKCPSKYEGKDDRGLLEQQRPGQAQNDPAPGY